MSAVITGDAVTRGKPDPEAYLLAAERLGVRAADCIALEDSPTGVAAAVGAGCATLAVPRVAPVPPGSGYVVRENGVQELSLAALCELVGPVRSARNPWPGRPARTGSSMRGTSPCRDPAPCAP